MDMDHAEALERIEIAAAEPEGLERLMAGDTPDAAAVAGHLAGCDSCQAQLVAIRRTAVLARRVIEAEPDPELKERTLAFIREVGRDRSGRPATASPAAAPSAPAETPPPNVVPMDRPASPHVPGRPVRVRRWIAVGAMAAAVVIALAAGFAGGSIVSPGSQSVQQEVAVLRETTQGTIRVSAQPDAQKVALVATDAAPSGAEGTVLFSGTSGELVMVATGLSAPPAGMEYGCWIETNGERRRIGKMYPGGELHAWVGDVDGLDNLPAGSVFGVSLSPIGGGAGQVVLTGQT
jgi:anti-sigma-K factor RskA